MGGGEGEYLLVLEEGALVDKLVPVFELEAQLPRRVCEGSCELGQDEPASG